MPNACHGESICREQLHANHAVPLRKEPLEAGHDKLRLIRHSNGKLQRITVRSLQVPS